MYCDSSACRLYCYSNIHHMQLPPGSNRVEYIDIEQSLHSIVLLLDHRRNPFSLGHVMLKITKFGYPNDCGLKIGGYKGNPYKRIFFLIIQDGYLTIAK